MIRNIIDLMELECSFRSYLLSQNVEFDDNGFPIFQASMFLEEWPDSIVTYQCRNNTAFVKEPSKTVICFYTADSRIYPRLEKVFDELDEYRRFMGVVSMDLTVTDDMDPELQQLIISVNQLFTMILAINGIRIIMNTRSGGLEFSTVFGSIPKGIAVSSGFLGCRILSEDNLSYIKKIIYLFPLVVLIYGKHDPIAEEQLDRLGFIYKVYPDTHRSSKCKENKYGR